MITLIQADDCVAVRRSSSSVVQFQLPSRTASLNC